MKGLKGFISGNSEDIKAVALSGALAIGFYAVCVSFVAVLYRILPSNGKKK